jgi:hypothetical protein
MNTVEPLFKLPYLRVGGWARMAYWQAMIGYGLEGINFGVNSGLVAAKKYGYYEIVQGSTVSL